MARVSLIEESATPDFAALAARIRGARGGTLHDFYRALLHSPGLAAAWFEFNNAVRFQSGLDERTRELVIMRVAALTGCDYVWGVHEQRYAAPAGVAPGEIAALRIGGNPDAFPAKERALLAYVDAMTREVAVPDTVFGGLRAHYDERAIVELTVLVAAYNMHVRFLRALDIGRERA
jgi:AhpD family alkylhydroperoxidase